MKMDPEFIGSYKVYLKLGEGGQAKVYLVSRNGSLFAAKIYEQGHSKNQSFQAEVEILQRLKIPQTIRIIQILKNQKVVFGGNLIELRNIIILEYASNGQLFDMILKKGAMKLETCKFIFQQLLKAIKIMKQQGICHRDLKPDNILIDSEFNLKVADFGLATAIQTEDGQSILTDKVGTQGFKSPQMEKGKYNGHQSDLFAAGVILFILYSGSPPFMNTKFSDKIFKMLREGNYQRFWSLHQKKKPEGFYSLQIKKLINSMLSPFPEKRLTLEELESLQWLRVSRQDQFIAKKEIQNKLLQIQKEDSFRIHLKDLKTNIN